MSAACLLALLKSKKFSNDNALMTIFFYRGDNDDGMTETDWPDRYIPTPGVGDLTGEYKVLFVVQH